MFHALSYLLYGNLDYSHRLRQRCCDMIGSDRRHLREFLVWTELEIEEYVQQLENPSVYAGHLELSLILRMFTISIYIYSILSSTVIKCILKEEHDAPTMIIRMLYVNGNHYMALTESNIEAMASQMALNDTSAVMTTILVPIQASAIIRKIPTQI